MKRKPHKMPASVSVDDYKAMVRLEWDEEEFQKNTIVEFKAAGWHVSRFRPARVLCWSCHGKSASCCVCKGSGFTFKTPVEVDGAGWPDLFAAHEERACCLFVELKSETGRLSEDQVKWQRILLACGQDHRVWRPRDWPEIVAVARGEK